MTITTVSSPRIAMAVCPEPEMALKAYSVEADDESIQYQTLRMALEQCQLLQLTDLE